MARRKHSKSRYGCVECKRRHMKCDESHPVCVNCSVGRMKCSFSGNVSVLPLAIRPALGPGANSSPSLLSGSRPSPSGQEDAAAATACPPHPSSSPPDHLLGERYSLLHLKLLQHFKDQLGTTMCVSQPAVEPMVQKAVGEAFTTPFLMDELLAFSAIHKSTLQDAENRDYYRAEATRLQTRALSQFNAAQASLSDDNCLAVFLFSTFLGQHVLFDTFSSHGDLAAFLDRLVQCLSLHGGIAAIAGRSWPTLVSHMPQLGAHADIRLGTAGASRPGAECAGLMELLGRSELSQSASQACRSAVADLQHMLDSQRAAAPVSGNRRIVAVQEWPVRVPKDYINLVAQRRPEALAILAYYSVLLHRARDYWVVGDAGEFLIRSITDYLGAYWADWLEWPNAMLNENVGDG